MLTDNDHDSKIRHDLLKVLMLIKLFNSSPV